MQQIVLVIARIGPSEANVLVLGENGTGKGVALAAEIIAGGGRVYLFGSGHSVIPVMDVFPRYGSFVGFYPLYDPRLMWSNVIGPHGARELLWLERREGYIEQFLQSYPIGAGDSLIVFSHGGMNAAPIEAARYARQRDARVIAVIPPERGNGPAESLERCRPLRRGRSRSRQLRRTRGRPGGHRHA